MIQVNYCRDVVAVVQSLSVPNSLWPYGMQHTGLPSPSPSPRACSYSCPLSQWCHPTISSLDFLFSFCPQSFPASGTFPKSQLFLSCDRNTGVSASASVLPMIIQGWFSLILTGLISLLSKGLSGVLQHQNSKASIPQCLASLRSSANKCSIPLGRP